MNLSQLRAFHAVATHGGFTRAARALHVTQPTLSGQVRALEDTYGAPLFERHGRGVALTELGRGLHGLTGQVFQLVDEAHQLLSAQRGAVRGSLRVAADAPFHVLPLLGAYRERYPEVDLALSFGNTASVLDAVLHRRADVAVLPGVARDARLRVVHLADEEVVLIVPRSHPWATRGVVDAADLTGTTVLRREEGSTTRVAFERALAELGIPTRPGLEVGSREAMREAVAAGLGVGVIFRGELGPDPRLAPVRVVGADLAVGEKLVCLARRAELPVIRALLELARH